VAIALRMTKLSDDGRAVTYSFGAPDGPQRTLVFDRVEERIWPEDNRRDGTFRAAAGKLARVLADNDDAPDTIAVQA
jgi:hypothetical protein